MSQSSEFYNSIGKIFSANAYAMKAAAGAWIALAGASEESKSALNGIADDTAAEPGVGLAELADRIGGIGGWGEGAAYLAQSISHQLQSAGDASSRSAERAESLKLEFERVEQARSEKADDASSMQGANAIQADKAMGQQDQRLQELRDEAAGELDALDGEFGKVVGGSAPSAPEVNAAGGGGISSGGGGLAGAGGGGSVAAGAGGPVVTAANGAGVGVGAYPYSSVVGPEGGDFAGWVQSPNSGFLVDPASGREFDPVSGRWIDPVTGRPFGEVTDYATRLSGLGGGPGGLAGAGGVGLAATGGGIAGGPGGAGFAGMYGGVIPPSVAHAGTAQPHMAQRAAGNLAHKAEVANRFAAREAAQGGRPYMPPPGAGAAGGGAAARAAAPVRPRPFTERPNTWSSRAADATARHRLTGPTGPAGASRGAPGPSPAAGAARAQTRSHDHPSRHQDPTDLREDPSVWESDRRGARGVLGE